MVLITLIIFFQKFFTDRFTFSSNTRDGQTVFKNVGSCCHLRVGVIITKRSKFLKLSDLQQRGIEDIDPKKVANFSIG